MRGWVAVIGMLLACSTETVMEPEADLKRVHNNSTATVTVVPDSVDKQPGDTFSVTCEPRNDQGNIIAGRECKWSSLDPAIVTIGPDDFIVTQKLTAVAVGVGRVWAQNGGHRDTVVVVVDTADTPPPPPPPPPGCTPTATHFCPGDDYQAKVAAAASGAVFTFGDGLYRPFRVDPKSGQTFSGPGGKTGSTVQLDGGRVLTGWTQSGATWYVGGQTQENADANAATCQAGGTVCGLAEDLFVDGVHKTRVASLAEVTGGTWYFDRTADRIYVGDNPAGREVITTVEPYAFGGTATGVTVQGLEVRHYAAARPGAVVNHGRMAGWVIQRNLIDRSGGRLVAVTGTCGAPGQLIDNTLTYGGQMGVWAQGCNTLIRGNEIAFNNTKDFKPGSSGEAGFKMSFCDDCVIEYNYSHDNDAPGLWADIDNHRITIRNNRVEDNAWRGIFYEISYTAWIHGNIVLRNGHANPADVLGAFEGAGILVSNSPDVEVYGNVVRGNRNGIMGREEDRGSGDQGLYSVTGLWVHDNCVEQSNGLRAAGITRNGTTENPYAAASNNRFERNTYLLSGGSDFRWSNNVDYTLAQWLGVFPLDAAGTC